MVAVNFSLLAIMIFYVIIFKLFRVKQIQKQMRYLKKKLFFGPFLALAYNAFIPICLAIDLNHWHDLHTHNGETLAHLFTDMLMIYLYWWFPCVILYVIFRKD